MRARLIIMMLLTVAACDTPEEVRPRNTSFFVKMYAGLQEGDLYANDIIATSDGGLLLAGTAYNKDGTTEIVLIKTDERGNEVWKYGAYQDLFQPTEAVSVVESTDGYIVGGNLLQQPTTAILLRIDLQGQSLLDSGLVITTDPDATPKENTLSKITLGSSGLLVSCNTRAITPNGDQGINGYVALYDAQTLNKVVVSGVPREKYFGLAADDFVTGAFEVADNTNIGNDNARYLVFGYTYEPNTNSDFDFYYIGISEAFDDPLPQIKNGLIERSGNQTGAYVSRFNDTFWMVGTSDLNGDQLFISGWRFTGGNDNDWVPFAREITSSEGVRGSGIALPNSDQYVLAGTKEFTNQRKEIYLDRYDFFAGNTTRFPLTFGTNTAAYQGSAVVVLPDGAIVVSGTADLDPVKKIVIIKTGPDGEMSF